MRDLLYVFIVVVFISCGSQNETNVNSDSVYDIEILYRYQGT